MLENKEIKNQQKAQTVELIAEKSEHKKEAWKGIMAAVEHLFAGKEENLIKGLLDNYTPKNQIVEGKEIKGEASGISFGSIFRLVSFAIRHPIHTFNLMKLARSPEIYQDPSFQRDLLKRDSTWNFIKGRANDLPQIGRILEGAGIEEFKPGKILGDQSMDVFKEVLKNEQNLKDIKALTLEATKSKPDGEKIVNRALELLAYEPNVREYFSQKQEAIKDYLLEMNRKVTIGDITRTMRNILSKDKIKNYKAIDVLFKRNPDLANIIADLLINKKMTDKKISQYLFESSLVKVLDTETAKSIKKFCREVREKTKPFLREYLELYGVNPGILEQTPAILNNIGEVSRVYQSIQTEGLYVWVGKALDLMINDPSLKEYISKNPTFISNVAKGVIKNTPALKDITDEYGFDPKILDILNCIMVKPEVARTIVTDLNKGDYLHLTHELINALNNKEEFVRLKETLQQQARDGLFNNLIKGIIEQNAKSVLMNGPDKMKELIDKAVDNSKISIEDSLKVYGISRDNIPQVAAIFPLLLESPETLQKVFDQFSLGQYTDMTRELLSIVDKRPEIRQYFTHNKDLFIGVLDAVFKNVPALQKYELKGDLYELFPILLNHAPELTEMIDLYKQNNYIEIGKKFFDLAQKDEEMKEYFITNKTIFIQNAVKSAGLEDYGIKQDEIVEIFDLLMKGTNAPKIQQLLGLYQEGKLLEVIKQACEFIDTDPEFKQYMKDNQENFSKIVNAVINKTPAIKTWTAGAELGQLVGEILNEPKLIKNSIEAYEKGGSTLVLAGVKAVGKVLMKGAFWGAVAGYFNKGGDKQLIINGILEEIAKRENDELTALSDFINATLNSYNNEDAQLKAKLTELMTKNTLFDGITIGSDGELTKIHNLKISGITFVNSKIHNVSFAGCIFNGCAFTGANIDPSASFAGSEIDGATLATMVDSLRKNKVALDNVKIIGDLSGIDLTGISLKGADLTEVTAMKNTNLRGADLEGIIFPVSKLHLLVDAYNISSAKFSEGVIEGITKLQENRLLLKIVDAIAQKAQAKGEEMHEEQINKLTQELNSILEENTPLRAEVIKVLEASPEDLINKNFPIDLANIKHISDFRDRASYLMTILYENRNNIAQVKYPLVAANIGGRVAGKLFGEAWNRGQDGLRINQTVEVALIQFVKENPGFDIRALSQHENFNGLIDSIKEELRAKTKYTTAGMVTGGVYLPEEIFTEALTKQIKVIIGEEVGQYKFSKLEKAFIQECKAQVTVSLFGTIDSNNKLNAAKLIEAGVKEAMHQLKEKFEGKELGELLQEKSNRIIGEVSKGWTGATRTGLIELFYKNSTYTTAGLATGGIYLDENKTANPEFVSKIKEIIETKMVETSKYQDIVRNSQANNKLGIQ